MTYTVHTLAELRQHAFDLARAFNVMVIEETGIPVDGGAAVGYGDLIVCVVTPIVCEATYVSALHEIGHGVAACGRLRDGRTANSLALMVEEERAAWEWAYAMATQFGLWTAAMESVRAIAFETYEGELRRRTEAAEAAVRERAGRPSEPVSRFVGRAAADVPPPEAPRLKVTRRESVADFLKRRKT